MREKIVSKVVKKWLSKYQVENYVTSKRPTVER